MERLALELSDEDRARLAAHRERLGVRSLAEAVLLLIRETPTRVLYFDASDQPDALDQLQDAVGPIEVERQKLA